MSTPTYRERLLEMNDRLSKSLLPKRKDETKFQQHIRTEMAEMEKDPKKYPGGREQAIAIAANEAGVAKAARTTSTGPFSGPRGGLWADPKHTIPWKKVDPSSMDEGKKKQEPKTPGLVEMDPDGGPAHEAVNAVMQHIRETAGMDPNKDKKPDANLVDKLKDILDKPEAKKACQIHKDVACPPDCNTQPILPSEVLKAFNAAQTPRLNPLPLAAAFAPVQAAKQAPPADAFLDRARRRYRVKEQTGESWTYSHELLKSAANAARMNRETDLSGEADAIMDQLAREIRDAASSSELTPLLRLVNPNNHPMTQRAWYADRSAFTPQPVTAQDSKPDMLAAGKVTTMPASAIKRNGDGDLDYKHARDAVVEAFEVLAHNTLPLQPVQMALLAVLFPNQLTSLDPQTAQFITGLSPSEAGALRELVNARILEIMAERAPQGGFVDGQNVSFVP